MTRNKKVLISGTFDLLHKGHKYLLEIASRYGDVFVLVDNDKAVRKRKGKGRPVNSAVKRMVDVIETGYVSWVAVNEKETPLEVILHFKPDFLVVGDDYVADGIVGLKEGASWGCKAIIVPRIGNISTSNILKRKKK